MSNQKPSFRFEIDNFSEQDDVISSDSFTSCGCKWYIDVDPNVDCPADGHLSLDLELADSTMLPTGVERSFNFYFVLLNQSGKELFRSTTGQARNLFWGWNPQGWEYEKTLPVRKLQEKGFLEKDKLIIEVYIQGGDVYNNKNKTKTINGFQVLASQVTKVRKIFTAHPDIALDFKPTIQEVKTAYMNVLLRVIETLNKPPKSLSETRRNKARSELSELMNVGFKLDWLKSKLEEVSLERKKPDVDESQVQQAEESVKKSDLMELDLKLDSLNRKLNDVSLERKKGDDNNESRAKQVEERVKNLELMELGLKLSSLNTKLDKVALERKKADDTNESRAKTVEKRVKNLELKDLAFTTCLKPKLDELERKTSCDAIFFEQIEDRVMGIEFKLDSLNTKLGEISNEKKKADDADGSLVQQLEESVKNIELMVSHLKVEVDKKKNKSSADDGFLLVD